MTFANWWTSKYGAETKDVTAQDFALMRNAYETGTRDEREACAKVFDANPNAEMFRDAIADQIRMRGKEAE